MSLTPQQAATLYRLAAGKSTPDTEPMVAVRWLRRYGLLDADHEVTDEGRAYLEHLRRERDRRLAQLNAERREIEWNPAAGMRDAIRRWKRGDRDG